jgi:ATP synthase protein I
MRLVHGCLMMGSRMSTVDLSLYIIDHPLQAKMMDAKAEEAASGSSKKQEDSTGFLSFSRVADLQDMSIDLSKQLREKPKPREMKRSAASVVPLDPLGGKGQLYAIPPTSAEQKSWARSSGYRARNSSVQQLMDDETAQKEREEASKEAAAAFEASKREYQLWTTATAAVCTALTYSFYTRVLLALALIDCSACMHACMHSTSFSMCM